jgi:DNA polymerase III epsilon subunit-like protein
MIYEMQNRTQNPIQRFVTPALITTMDRSLPSLKSRNAIIFDVETTGLLPKGNQSIQPMNSVNLSDYPYITQLSFFVFDLDTKVIRTAYNVYIKLPKEVEISQFITDLTGVTREICDQGVPITEALATFYNTYVCCDQIVAHNMEFDSTMIRVELERNCKQLIKTCPFIMGMRNFSNKLNPRMICTMRHTIDLCDIQRKNTRGLYKKFPKLQELYLQLFCNNDENAANAPKNLHNSLMDTLVCLRCYLELTGNHMEQSVFDSYTRLLFGI